MGVSGMEMSTFETLINTLLGVLLAVFGYRPSEPVAIFSLRQVAELVEKENDSDPKFKST